MWPPEAIQTVFNVALCKKSLPTLALKSQLMHPLKMRGFLPSFLKKQMDELLHEIFSLAPKMYGDHLMMSDC